jgi:DNA repair photolyase
MTEYAEVKIQRILNPTAINLGEYVINPYSGCAFRCLYCYVRSNRSVKRKNRPWGSYVDIRINAPLLLKKELEKKRPQRVLIGSTTDCFQPIERKYRLTEQILDVLNEHGVYYNILTRSPLISEYVPLLGKGFCESIYFTINAYSDDLKQVLEPASPPFTERIRAIETLLSCGIPAIPYVSPVLPWITEIDAIFELAEKWSTIDFECLNFSHEHTADVIAAIASVQPVLAQKYRRMQKDKAFFDWVWEELRKKVAKGIGAAGKDCHIFVHKYGNFYENSY